MKTLRLYVDSNFYSPYALSAYVALLEKGLTFDLATVDLAAGQQHRDAFAQPSLTARVPMLLHGDFALSESSAIAEYLDDTPQTLALNTRASKGQVERWAWGAEEPAEEDDDMARQVNGARLSLMPPAHNRPAPRRRNRRATAAQPPNNCRTTREAS